MLPPLSGRAALSGAGSHLRPANHNCAKWPEPPIATHSIDLTRFATANQLIKHYTIPAQPPLNHVPSRMRTNQIGEINGKVVVSSYELNRQRNNRINECNCRGIAVMCVQCIMHTDDDAK